MTVSTDGLAAIDMRVRPSWRWDRDGAIPPRYLASSEGGWQPMRQFMNSVLQDRILFGSDWPMLSHDRLMAEVPLLQLKDSVLEKYLNKNAERLLDRILG